MSRDRVQQRCVKLSLVSLFKALSPDRVHKRFVELSLVLAVKALSQDRVQQRLWRRGSRSIITVRLLRAGLSGESSRTPRQAGPDHYNLHTLGDQVDAAAWRFVEEEDEEKEEKEDETHDDEAVDVLWVLFELLFLMSLTILSSFFFVFGVWVSSEESRFLGFTSF